MYSFGFVENMIDIPNLRQFLARKDDKSTLSFSTFPLYMHELVKMTRLDMISKLQDYLSI